MVPERAPVERFTVSPAGNAGEMLNVPCSAVSAVGTSGAMGDSVSNSWTPAA